MLTPDIFDYPQLSLTQYIAQTTKTKVKARVLWQGFVNRMMPGDTYPQSYWLRQVCLLTEGVPRVLAQVYVPRRTLVHLPWVRHLGPKPLGQVLFRYFSPERIPLSTLKGSLMPFQQALSPLAKQRFDRMGVETTADSLTYVFSGMQLGFKQKPGAFDLFLEEVCLEP